MVDRAARDRLASVIEQFLGGEITAFQFDDRLDEVAGRSEDGTVRYVRQQLWFFYDDVRDHQVVLNHEAWNAVQRLLLLCRSDAEIVQSRTWHRSVWQVAGIGALALFVLEVARDGLHQAWIDAIPFGLLSVALVWWPRRRRAMSQQVPAMAPFARVAEIRTAMEATPTFRKQRYPGRPWDGRIRSPIAFWIMCLPSALIGIAVSPLALLLAALPWRETRVSVAQPARTS